MTFKWTWPNAHLNFDNIDTMTIQFFVSIIFLRSVSWIPWVFSDACNQSSKQLKICRITTSACASSWWYPTELITALWLAGVYQNYLKKVEILESSTAGSR